MRRPNAYTFLMETPLIANGVEISTWVRISDTARKKFNPESGKKNEGKEDKKRGGKEKGIEKKRKKEEK
jgi:hypothetical protein